MSSINLSAASLKFHAMIENVTPGSFEAEAQLADIRHLLEAAHHAGLMSDAERDELMRCIGAQAAVLEEAAVNGDGFGTTAWLRRPR